MSNGQKSFAPPGAQKGVDLSVVVPAYNDAARLARSLPEIFGYLRQAGHRFEVIVSEDGSTDDTRSVAGSWPEVKLVSHPRHTGKGFGVKQGIMAASGELVLITDADLATPLRFLPTLAAAVEAGAGLAIGSRATPGAATHGRTFSRAGAGRVFNILVQVLLTPGIRDTQCGFKLGRRDLLQKICRLSRLDGFAFDAEMVFLARRLGARVVEVPVGWHHVEGSRVRVVRDGVRMAGDVVKVFFWAHTRGYGM